MDRPKRINEKYLQEMGRQIQILEGILEDKALQRMKDFVNTYYPKSHFAKYPKSLHYINISIQQRTA